MIMIYSPVSSNMASCQIPELAMEVLVEYSSKNNMIKTSPASYAWRQRNEFLIVFASGWMLYRLCVGFRWSSQLFGHRIS